MDGGFCKTPRTDTHKEITPSNKTQSTTKSTNKDIWVTETLNQLFI